MTYAQAYQLYESIGYSPEAARYMDNCQRIDVLAKQVRELKREDPAADIVLKLDCYNRAEADELLEYARTQYPDVHCYASYFVWPGGRQGWP